MMKLNRSGCHYLYYQLFWIIFLFLSNTNCNAQSKLLPGFDKEEYAELLKTYQRHYDQVKTDIPLPVKFKSVYRSPVVGLENRWDLWIDNRSVALINLRGTTKESVSWLENFYMAMVPATGELKLTNDFTFKYHLADNPKAAVHTGWLIGMAFLAKDILPKIDSCYKSGIRDFLIMGHSQGGALTYLLTSHLYDLQKQKILPADIRFKTYCSAGPKPGNVFYAYEYENLVAGGWGYNVINAADWVPETPFSIQTLNDFNVTNPFINADAIIKKQKFITRLALRHAYKGLKKPSEKAQRNYQKYLGNYASKIVVKSLPEFQPPVYVNTSNYARTGPTIVLLPDAGYYKLFPDSKENVFVHHFLQPYLYLLGKYKH